MTSSNLLSSNNDVFSVFTALEGDGRKPCAYQTAVYDKRYYDKWTVVEAYKTNKDAILGHHKWTDTMAKNPPSSLPAA